MPVCVWWVSFASSKNYHEHNGMADENREIAPNKRNSKDSFKPSYGTPRKRRKMRAISAGDTRRWKGRKGNAVMIDGKWNLIAKRKSIKIHVMYTNSLTRQPPTKCHSQTQASECQTASTPTQPIQINILFFLDLYFSSFSSEILLLLCFSPYLRHSECYISRFRKSEVISWKESEFLLFFI